jgi:hypothetical protein
MKEFLSSFLVIILIVVAALGVSWLATGNDFFLYKYFAPKRAAVERQVFEETKSYNQGVIQELQNMQFEYIKADKEAKAALASIILHRAADYPEDKMPDELKKFIHELKYMRSVK